MVKDLGSAAVNLSRVSGDALLVQAAKEKGARAARAVCASHGRGLRAAKETLDTDAAVASVGGAGAGSAAR